MEKEDKKILDLINKKETFDKISSQIEILDKAFRALNTDYSYHVENTFGKDHKIFEMKKDIEFRLFSSKFHLQLLLQQHFKIEKRIESIYNEDRESIIRSMYPSNPIFDYCEKEITAIFDSIIFHLASVYDYLSAIINFICNNKNETISKWSQLNNACRQKGVYLNKNISKIIIDEHNQFVNNLYKYRSRLIHSTSDVHPISFDLILSSGKTNVKFFATNSLIKNFSELREKAKTHKITVSYSVNWIIDSTLKSIMKILFGLKSEMEKNSTFWTRKDQGLTFMHRDPKTGIGEFVSKKMWEEVEKEVKNHN